MENSTVQNEVAPLRAKVVIRNPQGLHMRPAMRFARIAMRYRAAVTVRKLERAVNGKSGLQLMTLAALPGTELDLEVNGEDAAIALPILVAALAAASPDGMEAQLAVPRSDSQLPGDMRK